MITTLATILFAVMGTAAICLYAPLLLLILVVGVMSILEGPQK